ncbi:MAG: dTDP-glucose 4,6-dehydratase [Magnetospirillum sp.]|nr:dTDP-glucose 4,6-dehydratase [Magnetospirillum sp.]
MAQTSPLLVTGGAGFIGSCFVPFMIGRGHALVTLDALTYAGFRHNLAAVMTAPGHVFVEGDICDGDLVADLLRRHRPHAVVNIAAETHVDRSIDGPAAFVRTNILGTATLLEECRRHWRDLPSAERGAFRFLQVSTDEVYGSVAQGQSSEGAPYSPTSPYAASKASADFMVRSYFRTYGLPTLVTHGTNTFGPRQFPEKLIPLMILNALDGQPLPVYGDGGNQREWLYVQDHCAAIAEILDKGRAGESYNIGSGRHLANLEVVRTLCALLDDLAPRPDRRRHSEAITHVTDRPGHDFRYAVDCAKLGVETGWSPMTDVAEGLRTTVRWYLDNEAWCRSITQSGYRRDRLGLASHA